MDIVEDELLSSNVVFLSGNNFVFSGFADKVWYGEQ
jgi:hypothetical protein